MENSNFRLDTSQLRLFRLKHFSERMPTLIQMFLNMVCIGFCYQFSYHSLFFLFLVSYIKSVDGLAGCYRGLTPKLVGNILSSHLSEHIADYFNCPKPEDDDDEDKDYKNSEEELAAYYKRFEVKLKRDLVTHTAGAIIASPFHVISIRMMAQFVGQETKYSSIVGSIIQIYKDEGIMGFFSGLIPRLIFDLTCVIVASTATYIVGRHLIREREGRMYFGSLTSFVCTSIFYPLNVVSTCMIVNGSG